MKRTVILGSVLLLLHNILVIAKIRIDADKTQIWEVSYYSNEFSYLEKQDISSNNSIPFQSKQAFIMLKIRQSRWSIFYWLGKEANLKLKKDAARLTRDVWFSLREDHDNLIKLFRRGNRDDMYCKFERTSRSFILQPSEKSSENMSSVFALPIRTPRRIIPNIYRETDGNESDLFVTNFEQYAEPHRFKYRQSIMELYEIKWITNKFFQNGTPSVNLISLWSEINEKDNIYVLDKGNEVVISGNITNGKLKEIKNALVYNLITEKLPNQIEIKYSETQGSIRNHYRIPEIFNQQQKIRKKERKIFSKIILHSRGIHMKNVKSSFEEINENHCYIIQNENIYYIYIYIGKDSNLSSIYFTLEKAEEMIYYNQKYTKIIFAVDADILTVNDYLKHPTAFWVNFDERPTGFLPTNARNVLSAFLFNSE